MVGSSNCDTDTLLRRAREGDERAREALLMRHQERLRQMIGFRLDRRLAARVDPSDVVQEVLAEASQKLSDYLRRRPLPFYPWLRQLALERLIALHRVHVRAQKRTVSREEVANLPLTDESAVQLVDRLMASAGSPISQLLRDELRSRVHAALLRLAPGDREVLVLRHLEQLSIREIAAVLGIREGAVKTRHLRALQRFRATVMDEQAEEAS